MQRLLIDVSEHNGTINWEQAKGHIDGAILRCGYGMDIASQDDKQWARNVAECERLGIPYGVYIYSYATNTDRAKSEAQHVLRLIQGHKLSYPVYFDMEEPGTEGAAVANAITFGDIIEAAGYWCGVYYNRNWHNNVVKGQLDRFTRWGAGYGTNNGQKQDKYKPGFGEDIWQYSSKGSVPGISGGVDVNVCYRDFPAEITGGSAPDPVPQPTPTPAPSPAPSSENNLISQGQQHLNNFCGAGLSTDGIWGSKTQAGVIKGFQAACNHDYKSGLKEDGIWGPKTQAAIGNHTVRLGESQYMVTAVEAALYCNGYDPKGCESPGKYGNGCKAAVEQFQKDNGLSCDGIAGKNTIYKLCRV